MGEGEGGGEGRGGGGGGVNDTKLGEVIGGTVSRMGELKRVIPNVHCRPPFPTLVKKKPHYVARFSVLDETHFILFHKTRPDFVAYLDVGGNLVKIKKRLHIHQ